MDFSAATSANRGATPRRGIWCKVILIGTPNKNSQGDYNTGPIPGALAFSTIQTIQTIRRYEHGNTYYISMG